MSNIKSHFDKVIVVEDDQGPAVVVVHDTEAHKKTFYKLTELGMDEIMEMLNPERIESFHNDA